MEQRGNNPQKNVVVVIPARYHSVRLPGKLMLDIAGRPMILHTVAQAKQASGVDRVIVATDDERIFDAVVSAGHEAFMSRREHASGSDRIAEVAEALPSGSIVVNVQGDEPLISPRTIESAVEAMLLDDSADIVTSCEAIVDVEDILSPNVVKVVLDKFRNAMYFSRSPIPFPRDAVARHGNLREAIAAEPELISIFRKHTGLYVYRREYLLEFTKREQADAERIESLEQLRALESGGRIKVIETAERSIGIDTESDLVRVRHMMQSV